LGKRWENWARNKGKEMAHPRDPFEVPKTLQGRQTDFFNVTDSSGFCLRNIARGGYVKNENWRVAENIILVGGHASR